MGMAPSVGLNTTSALCLKTMPSPLEEPMDWTGWCQLDVMAVSMAMNPA